MIPDCTASPGCHDNGVLQRGHMVLGISGVLCAGVLYSWVKSQNADKEVLADKNHKGESKQFPAASK